MGKYITSSTNAGLVNHVQHVQSVQSSWLHTHTHSYYIYIYTKQINNLLMYILIFFCHV